MSAAQTPNKNSINAAARRPQSMTRWILSVAIVLTLCFGLSTSAFALNLEEIKAMAASGALPDNTLIGIIENSGDKFKITPAVEKDLKGAGLSERVINALKATDLGSSGGGGGGGLAPAAGGSGNLGPTIAKAGSTFQNEYDYSKRKKVDDDRKASGERDAAVINADFTPVDKLTRDFAAVEDKWNALAICHNFLTKHADALDPTGVQFYKANWCKGEAYHSLGLHDLAAELLYESVRYGSDGEHFTAAFLSFAKSAKKAGFYPDELGDELQYIPIDNQTAEFQDSFHFFIGKFFMLVGRSQSAKVVKEMQEDGKVPAYEKAVKSLVKVSADSVLKPKAHYAAAVMQASKQLLQLKSGVENFQKAIVLAEASEDDENRDIIELSYLALARIAFEIGNYDGALYYYQKVDRFSTRYPRALFESAWTYFLKGDHRRALGTFHSLHSPYYDDQYFPDLWILESTIYLNLCRYEEATKTLEVFNDIYLTRLPLLTQFIENTQAKADADEKIGMGLFYEAVAQYYEQKEKGGSQEKVETLPPLFLEAVLADIRFYNTFKEVEELRKELKILEARADVLGEVGQDLLREMEEKMEGKLYEAGLNTHTILIEIQDSLSNWDVTRDEVSIDIDIAEKDLLETCLTLESQGKKCEFTENEETVLFLVADDWQYWPFEGEYWVDEVGSYKSYLSDRCMQIDAMTAGPAE